MSIIPFTTKTDWLKELTKEERIIAILVKNGIVNDLALELICNDKKEIEEILFFAKSRVDMSG